MDKKNLTIAVLVLVLVAIVGVYSYNYISSSIYSKGAEDGIKYVNNALIEDIKQDGALIVYIPIQTSEVNSTYKVTMVINSSEVMR